MSLDSKAARYSVISISAPWSIGVFPDTSKGQAWRQAAGWGYAGILLTITVPAPDDDDADVTVTNRTDRDGATIRVARLFLSHAARSLKRDAYGPPLRVAAADYDRWEARHELAGGTDLEGRIHRFGLQAPRAGDVFGLRRARLEFDPVPREVGSSAADATTGTDRDGAHVRPPTVELRFALDSTLRGDLSVPVSATQDRYGGRFDLSGRSRTEGRALIVSLTCSRAGEALDLRRLRIEHDPVPGERASRARSY